MDPLYVVMVTLPEGGTNTRNHTSPAVIGAQPGKGTVEVMVDKLRSAKTGLQFDVVTSSIAPHGSSFTGCATSVPPNNEKETRRMIMLFITA